jgi:hypothetical protein
MPGLNNITVYGLSADFDRHDLMLSSADGVAEEKVQDSLCGSRFSGVS